MKKIFLIIICVLLATGSLIAIMFGAKSGVLPPKVMVADVSIGGMTVNQAKEKVINWWKEVNKRPVRFYAPELKQPPEHLSASQCGLVLDLNATFKEITPENLLSRASRRVGLTNSEARNFSIKFTFNSVGAADLREFVEDHQIKDIYARARLIDGRIEYSPEKPHYVLDESRLLPLLTEAVLSNEKIELPLNRKMPRVTMADLEKIKEIVSKYTTTFNEGTTDRCFNIRLASRLIDGIVLLPGDKFSFNQIVGKRTQQDGYRLATVFLKGKKIKGFGGGVCQVSTTLYNAAILANLQIVERHNHSMPVHYVPIGRDATVSYGSLDMAFKNTMSNPIAVASKCSPGRISFYILGNKNDGEDISIEAVPEEMKDLGHMYVEDKTLDPGTSKVVEEGGKAGKAVTYRSLIRHGKLVSRQLLHRSHYRGGMKITARNTGTKKIIPPQKDANLKNELPVKERNQTRDI